MLRGGSSEASLLQLAQLLLGGSTVLLGGSTVLLGGSTVLLGGSTVLLGAAPRWEHRAPSTGAPRYL